MFTDLVVILGVFSFCFQDFSVLFQDDLGLFFIYSTCQFLLTKEPHCKIFAMLFLKAVNAGDILMICK